MEQDKLQSQLLSSETIQLHGIDYVFSIGTMHDKNGVIDGLYLQTRAVGTESRTRPYGDLYFDPDFAFLKAVQLAAIETERADAGFIERNGIHMFQMIADKINKHKKNKAKKKVFSLRFNTELQTKFAEKCKQTGETQSEVIRTFMERFISGVES